MLVGLATAACGGDDLGPDFEVTAGGADEATTPKGDRTDSAPRVELKVTLASSSIGLARSRLRLEDGLAEQRKIWFYDTPALALFDAGVVLRARDIKGKDDDSTVKLRPLAAADVDHSWLAVEGFKCEIDRLPGRSVSSCSLTAIQDEDEIDDVGDGDRDIDKLFSEEQEDFLAAYAPEVDWESLRALGPVPARVWKLTIRALPANVTAELWDLPDQSQVLELSMKVDERDADAAQDDLLAWVANRRLEIGSTQETKTRRALELLAPGSRP